MASVAEEPEGLTEEEELTADLLRSFLESQGAWPVGEYCMCDSRDIRNTHKVPLAKIFQMHECRKRSGTELSRHTTLI